jgi:hypothetical protein
MVSASGTGVHQLEEAMSHRVRADGDTWNVRLDRSEEAPGVNALVFMCESNPQRPYRVSRINDEDAASEPRDLGEARLKELFAASQVMDYVRNPDALG